MGLHGGASTARCGKSRPRSAGQQAAKGTGARGELRAPPGDESDKRWMWLKIQQLGLLRFWSMFPLTRQGSIWVPVFRATARWVCLGKLSDLARFVVKPANDTM